MYLSCSQINFWSVKAIEKVSFFKTGVLSCVVHWINLIVNQLANSSKSMIIFWHSIMWIMWSTFFCLNIAGKPIIHRFLNFMVRRTKNHSAFFWWQLRWTVTKTISRPYSLEVTIDARQVALWYRSWNSSVEGSATKRLNSELQWGKQVIDVNVVTQ